MRKAVVRDWVETEPKVREWANALAKKAKATGRNYSSLLYLYWTRNKRFYAFKSTAQWLDEIREQQDSPDITVRRAWGKELEAFNLSYKGKSGNFASKSQNNLRATVLSFLKYHIGEPEEYDFTIGTQEQLKAEAIQKEAETPPTREDLKQLYNQCRTNRDRALLLTLINGFGLSEWLDFANSWHQYKAEIEAGTVPLKVTIPFRSKTLRKTKVDSYVYLWDDSVEALKELLQERKRELGHDLTKNDNLFETDQRQPLNDNRIEILFRHLAERSGLLTKIGRLHRLRPHKIGRTFFATEAVNAGVDPAVREFVLAHKTDNFGGTYVQFHKTQKGEELIRRELLKLRPVLNIKSDKGTELPRDSYFEQTIETLAISKGMDPEELKSKLIYYASKLPVYQKIETRLMDERKGAVGRDGGLHVPPLWVVQTMTKEELFPAVITLAKSLSQPTAPKVEQKPILVSELETYLAQGWSFRSVINSEKVLVEKPANGHGDFDQAHGVGVGA